jgi:hypothetical protein
MPREKSWRVRTREWRQV